MGAWLADDTNDSILSTVLFIQFTVHTFRMHCFLSNETEIVALIHEIGKQVTNDHNEFLKVSKKLKICMQLVNSFILTILCAIPFFSSDKKLVFYIAIPLDWKNDATEFWLAHAYIVVGAAYAVVCGLFTIIIWFLMINCAIKYEMLGNQLRSVSEIGTMGKSNVSKTYQQKMIVQHLIVAIERHQSTNKYIVNC